MDTLNVLKCICFRYILLHYEYAYVFYFNAFMFMFMGLDPRFDRQSNWVASSLSVSRGEGAWQFLLFSFIWIWSKQISLVCMFTCWLIIPLTLSIYHNCFTFKRSFTINVLVSLDSLVQFPVTSNLIKEELGRG